MTLVEIFLLFAFVLYSCYINNSVAAPVSLKNSTSANILGSPFSGFPTGEPLGSLLPILALSGNNYIIVYSNLAKVQEFREHVSWLRARMGVGDDALGKINFQFDFGTECAFCGYAGTFHPQILSIISRLSDVSIIAKDDVVRISQVVSNNEASQASGAALQPWNTQSSCGWNLARIASRQSAKVSPFSYTYNSRAGEGVDAYIIDTGVNVDHEEFEGRASRPLDFNAVMSEDASLDLNGHGTHVAGIIGSKTFGVAKRVSIYSLKVLDRTGAGPWSSTIAAVNYVVKRRKSTGRPSVINISISGARNDAVNRAVEAAVAAGVHVVVAAGNSAQNACQFSPASAKGVVTVSSSGKSDMLSYFSNFGSCVTINAPGESITSTAGNSKSGTRVMTGTSMASPHTAGAIAVIVGQVPSAPPSVVSTFLQKSATQNAVVNDVSGSRQLLYVPAINLRGQ